MTMQFNDPTAPGDEFEDVAVGTPWEELSRGIYCTTAGTFTALNNRGVPVVFTSVACQYHPVRTKSITAATATGIIRLW